MATTSKKRLYVCAVIAATLVAVMVVLANYSAIQTSARWILSSRRYKSEVLAQPAMKGEFRHIEWGGWGMAGQDTTVYLVYDPNDSLSSASRTQSSGKFSGLPCEVVGVHRLEANWYTVQFYTNESWGQKNALDCSGKVS